MTLVERIEIGIARHWPDIAKICETTGATRAQVDAVIERLDAIEGAARYEHDCARHPAGSLECHDNHNCWCHECKTAAQMRSRAHEANRARSVELRGHAEWERLRKAGVRIGEMPAWVREAQRAYDGGRKRAKASAA